MYQGKLENLGVRRTSKTEVSNVFSPEARRTEMGSQGTRKVLVNEEFRH